MEPLAAAGFFLATSAWMMRYSMTHQRSMSERFIRHLENLLQTQQEEYRLHRSAIRDLTSAVRRNTRLLEAVMKEQNGTERNERASEAKVSNRGN